jgi:integrase
MPLLTDLVIRQTKAPAKGRVELWDSKVRGLLLRITHADARTWSVFYRFNGEKRRYTLGAFRAEESIEKGLTLGEARKQANAALRQVAAGVDPQTERLEAKRVAVAEQRRAGPTFEDLAEKWLASAAAKAWKPKTRKEFVRLVRVELVPALGDLAPEAVTKAQIRAVYDRIEQRSDSVAKHTLAVLRLLYRWAAEEDHVDTMPVFPKRGTQSNRRTRVLEESELQAVWRALTSGLGAEPKIKRVDMMAEAFKLMLLTGQRRGEVLSMRWRDVTEESRAVWWTIPAERHKGGRDHRVPLTTPAVDTLKRLRSVSGEGEWVFPAPRAEAKEPFVANPQKAAERLWSLSGVEKATLHDLRRTVATYAARAGTPRVVVSKILGHADVDVTGRYDAHAYDREKREALTKWAANLARIVAGKKRAKQAKVLPWARSEVTHRNPPVARAR